MQRKITRRSIVKNGMTMSTCLLSGVALLGRESRADGLMPLDPSDPTAKALAFVTDSRQAANAKPNQKCDTCAQFQGKPGDAAGGCTIFGGKSVPAAGWCSAFVIKA